MPHIHVSLPIWIIFNVFIAALLILDLLLFHKKAEAVRVRSALIWTLLWILLAFGFNALVYFWQGQEPAIKFLTGYLVEKSLSVDNLFVFLLIFSYFKVPPTLQRRPLFWGIFCALILRLVFIFAGLALLERFHWVIYVFGGVLIFSGIKFGLEKEKEIHPAKNPLLRLARRFFPITHDFVGNKFWTRHEGKLALTPLFIVLIAIESTDIIFAVDSVPAVLAVTRDPFIAYSSNAFAILGLRSLYFALSGVMGMFHYLHYGLSAILVYIGIKMCLSGFYPLPTLFTLLFLVAALGLSIGASMLWPEQKTAK
jgi:tellurite resistance protein TerC